jgi:hypothetical protein
VLGLGSVFSALEVVPLLFVGFEAWQNLQLSKAKPWVRRGTLQMTSAIQLERLPQSLRFVSSCLPRKSEKGARRLERAWEDAK